MSSLQVVPAVAQPTQQASALQAMLKHARDLLGVSEFSSKRFIKNAIYENFYWKKKTIGQTREQFEAAVALLLKHHKPMTSAEAKAARAREEADKKIRDEFRSQLYRVERGQALVVDVELASVRKVLRTVYESLSVKERMVFIKIAGRVFNLTRREKAALDKQDAENRAKYEAQAAKERAVKNALQAYYSEKNPAKKQVLWKAYRDLTKEDRQKKAAAKKAEEKRITDGLANVESVKANDPELWSEAVNAAAEATAAQIIGRYFWGATLRDRKGNASTYGGSQPEGYQKIQIVIMTIAGILAELKLGLLDDDDYPTYRMGYLADVCAAHGSNERDVLHELRGYAEALIEANWPTILATGTYLLATGEIKSRKFRTIHHNTTGSDEFRKPAFAFSPALVSVMVPLPVSQPQPQPLSPQQAAAIMSLTKALVN